MQTLPEFLSHPGTSCFLLCVSSGTGESLQGWLLTCPGHYCSLVSSLCIVGTKYSLSPNNHLEDGSMNMETFLRGFEEKGIKNERPEDQLSKEKKKILFSFCEVCNIQLNSAAQAQVHYNGKSHRKRVKQLSDGQPLPAAQGSGPLLASPGSNTSTAVPRGAPSSSRKYIPQIIVIVHVPLSAPPRKRCYLPPP
ncbi:Zinc finger protein 385B [Fukomys damarensis]|uniref:Zinc finger protein 385B n=1 Tax=Fukomys damarensis TaxID=885580 RepID=A0A091DBW5_FUKDA|nr:Zinc finger protein 385B [Fukomys damarensis]